jgi:hypothetical protein
VGPASVRYEVDEKFEDPKYIFFFEIHSHGDMNAFFSSIDDADEKSDRFYGVIGKVGQKFPEIKLRLCLGKRKYNVDIEDIFEIEDKEDSFPKEWLDNIKKAETPKYKYVGKSPVSYMPHEHDPRNYWWNNSDEEDDDSVKSLQQGISDWLNSKNSELTNDEMAELRKYFEAEEAAEEDEFFAEEEDKFFAEEEDVFFDIRDICEAHHSSPSDVKINNNKDDKKDMRYERRRNQIKWF